MRFIIFGVGAVGGTLAACLARSGNEVIGIARGRQLAAINDSGLTLRTPDGDHRVAFECVDGPAGLDLRADDAILFCVKSQDTGDALASLLAAGAVNQPVFCFQNGVANERMALRHFNNVYGVSVMMPCDYETPGVVCAYGTPRVGMFDIGRYPAGTDDMIGAMAEILEKAGMAAFPQDKVMPFKYGKLLLNLSNVLDAGFPNRESGRHWSEKARGEALAAYGAAGIEWMDVGFDDPRRAQFMKLGTIPGATRLGSSSRQSLLRGAGSIETNYLNGEIALLGRLNGVPVPVNAALCRIGRKLVAGVLKTGEVGDADVEAELVAA